MSDNPNHLCEPQIREEYEAWAHERIHESIAQNNIWVEKYKINDCPRWDYSLEHATLTFSEDGNPKLFAVFRPLVQRRRFLGMVMG